MSSLLQQRTAIEHCLVFAQQAGVEDTILDNARSGCLSLAWFERREHLTKELIRLNKEAPYLAELLQAFPGGQVREVNFHALGGDHDEISQDA